MPTPSLSLRAQRRVVPNPALVTLRSPRGYEMGLYKMRNVQSPRARRSNKPVHRYLFENVPLSSKPSIPRSQKRLARIGARMADVRTSRSAFSSTHRTYSCAIASARDSLGPEMDCDESSRQVLGSVLRAGQCATPGSRDPYHTLSGGNRTFVCGRCGAAFIRKDVYDRHIAVCP